MSSVYYLSALGACLFSSVCMQLFFFFVYVVIYPNAELNQGPDVYVSHYYPSFLCG